MVLLNVVLLLVYLSLPTLTLGIIEFKNLFSKLKDRGRSETSPPVAIQLPTSLPLGKIGEEVVFYISDSTYVTGVTDNIVQRPSSRSTTLYGSIISGGTFIVICGIIESEELSCAGNIRPVTKQHIQYELRYEVESGLHKINSVNLDDYENDYSRESSFKFSQSIGGKMMYPESEKLKSLRITSTSDDAVDVNQIVDVMIVYTKTAVNFAGSENIMQYLVHLVFDETNQILENSEVDLRVRLVHSMHTIDRDFVENDSLVLLLNIANTTDGILDEEMDIRMEVGADLIHAVEGDFTRFGGMGFVTCASPNYCSSVSQFRSFIGGFVFLHELGHNMGLMHDHANSLNSDGKYPYSHGHCWDNENSGCGQCSRSVMAYSSCVTQLGCSQCTKRVHVSNPNVVENGYPTGVNESANSALSLNQTKNFYANIVQSKTDGGLIFSTDYSSGLLTIKGWRLGNGSDIVAIHVMNYESGIVMQTRDSVIVSIHDDILVNDNITLLWDVVVWSISAGVTNWTYRPKVYWQEPPESSESWYNGLSTASKVILAIVGLWIVCFCMCFCIFGVGATCYEECYPPCREKMRQLKFSSYLKAQRNSAEESTFNDTTGPDNSEL